MPIHSFETIVVPTRLPSPFLGGTGKPAIKGPGGIIDAEKEKTDTGNSNAKRRKDTTTAEMKGASYVVSLPTTAQGPSHPEPSTSSRPPPNRTPRPDSSVLTAAGGTALGNNAHIEKLPAVMSKCVLIAPLVRGPHYAIRVFFCSEIFRPRSGIQRGAVVPGAACGCCAPYAP